MPPWICCPGAESGLALREGDGLLWVGAGALKRNVILEADLGDPPCWLTLPAGK